MKITIHNQQQKDRAVEYLKALDISKPMLLVVAEAKKNRSAAQRSIQWVWMTFIAGETGETKEEVHERYKGRYAIHILERDDPEYADMIETVRSVYHSGAKDHASKIYAHIVRETSTTRFNTKQMTEYLECIDRHCMSISIFLPRPEDQFDV